MDKYELQKLRDLPIEGVAERLGLQVTRHKCLCPFHEDHHPSLSFSVRKNTYRCFVCGASGGTIDLVMKYLHKNFIEACRWLNPTPSPSPKERGATNQWTTSTSNITNPSPLPSGGDGGGSHMWPDNDAPGERLFLQLKEVLPSLVHHQLPPDCKDYSDYYLRYLCQKR